MNGGESENAAAKASTPSLAFACTVVWVIAAASTGPLGIWVAFGGAAVALGAAVWVLDRARPAGEGDEVREQGAGTVLLTSETVPAAGRPPESTGSSPSGKGVRNPIV